MQKKKKKRVDSIVLQQRHRCVSQICAFSPRPTPKWISSDVKVGNSSLHVGTLFFSFFFPRSRAGMSHTLTSLGSSYYPIAITFDSTLSYVPLHVPFGSPAFLAV